MSKFEDKVQKMDTDILKAVRSDLQKNIALGRIGFWKRAGNILASIIGTDILRSAGLNFYQRKLKIGDAIRKEQDTKIKEAFDELGNRDTGSFFKKIGKLTYNRTLDDFPEEFQKSVKKYKNVEMVSGIVQLGAIVYSSVKLNQRSKRKQEDRLNFVETELAKREMKTHEINEPQRG